MGLLLLDDGLNVLLNNNLSGNGHTLVSWVPESTVVGRGRIHPLSIMSYHQTEIVCRLQRGYSYMWPVSHSKK